MVCALSPVLPLFTFTTQHSVQGNQYCQDWLDETFISLAISNIWWNILREQFGSLGVQIITITDVSGVWDTAQSGHSQRPHLTTAIRQSPTLLPVYPPIRGQQGGHVTRYPPIRVSPHYWQSRVTSTYPPPVTSRENETEYTDLYEIMFITVCGAFPAWIWILTGYFLWGCLDIERGLVSDGYFAVLLDNWIIVVSELSWFLIILW